MKQRRAVFVVLVTSLALAGFILFNIFITGAASSTDSLVGYWKFEETIAADNKTDSSGDGRTGSPSGTVLPQPSNNTPPTDFANGRSLRFNNTNNAVNVTSAESIDDLPALTISAWIYPMSYAGESAQGRIIDKTNSTNGWSFYVDNGALSFYANFSTSPLKKTTTATLPTDTWAHVAVTWDGTENLDGVKFYIDGVEQVATGSAGSGGRISDESFNIVIGNNSALNRTFSGDIDELRLYSRTLDDTELAEIANGGHPTAVWTGAVSTDYENSGNWSTGVIPDPYTNVVVGPAANQPIASANIAMAGLTIEEGARLNLLGYNLTMNDGGQFSNEGTLQLRNTQSITGLTNDTDSGTVMITPQSDTTGLKLGNSYHNLIINDSTFGHWPLDESAGSEAKDVSGYDLHAAYQGDPTPSANVPNDSKFANDNSLAFDGVDDYLSFPERTIPSNATWCAWVYITSGDGVVLGSEQPGQYALAIFGGNEVRAHQYIGNETASWNVASLYNNWNHICITQTTTTTSSLVLYINGVSQGGAETIVGGIGAVSTIGSDTDTYFEGLIDDVRIYSRVLTGMEIGRMTAGNLPDTILYRTTLGAATTVYGDLVINSGRLDVSTNNYQLNIGGNFDNHGGVFVGRNGTVSLIGGDQRIAGSTTFYNLEKTVSAAAELSFGRGSTTTIQNQMTFQGAENELLSLRSTTEGVEWYIDPQGSKTVGYLDVKDSHNINAYPVDITNTNTIDSGNNTNWTINVAPDDPTDLGGSSYVNGSFVGDSTPTLTFTLTDQNNMDQLRYHIQIDDDQDFSSPEVDYISGLGSQGARGFTVGQSEADDEYTVGEPGMTLLTADYYWRVRAIDDYVSPNVSDFSVANDGEVAFRLDVTPPSLPGTPTTESPHTEKRPTWAWDESEDAGVGMGSPAYMLQWSKDATFSTGVSSSTTDNNSFTHGSNLSDGQWYFRVRAVDALGNQSAWSTSVMHLIDTTGPETPVAPYTPSPTSFNRVSWSWAPTTDAGIGLADEPYIVQWSQTSNFSSGVYSDTSDTNSYVHDTPLGDGTWYFRVRAVDALGNQSAWSASGTVLVDATPPSLPGAPQTNDPTNDNTPTWTWDASIDDGVGLTGFPYTVQWSSLPDFSSLAGSTTSATNSYTHGSPLADGTWYIRVNAKDLLSNLSSYSETGQVTIDTVAPDAPEMPETETPTNNERPVWSWNIPDDVGVGLSDSPFEIEWSQDEDFESAEGGLMINSNSYEHVDELAEGTWYFRVRAWDKAGNVSDWSELGEVYIDITPPTVPGAPNTEDPVNDNTPKWDWLASTDTGIGLRMPAYDVQWSQDETFEDEQLIIESTATSNTFTHDDPLDDGTWYFRVRAVDAVGNASDWSEPGEKVVDILPPTIPGRPTTVTPTNDNTPTWEWDESFDAGVGLDELPYLIEWSQDPDFEIGTQSDSVADPTFTHDDPLDDGTWYFRVRAVDDVGNISVYSEVGEVFVDTTAPSQPGMPSTETPTTNSAPIWTWAASNDGAGTGLADEGYLVEWSMDSDFEVDVQSSATTSNSFEHAVELADGTWYFRVRAVDKVGNTSSYSSVGSVEIDDTPPSVPGQPTTTTPTDNKTPVWNWIASTDNGVGLRSPAYDVEWSQDPDFETGVFSATVDTNEFPHSTELDDGTWYFRVRAVDALNNRSEFSDSGIVLVSTDGPTVPGQPLTETPTTNTKPEWEWEASESDAGLESPAYYLEWSQDPDFEVGVYSDTTNDAVFEHQDPLDDGIWYFRVRAHDKTGIFSLYSVSGTVHIDTTPPSKPGQPATETPTNDNMPEWSWNDSADTGVGLADESYIVEWSQDPDFENDVQSDAVNDTNFLHTDQLADGTWYFRVRAVDKVNNMSDWSDAGQVIVDATAPSVPTSLSTTPQTSDNTPTWTWDASTDSGVGLGNPAYEVQWSRNDMFTSSVATGSAVSETYTHTDPLADGTWYFRVRAIDGVGNISDWSEIGQVEIDVSIPTVPGIPTTGGQSVNSLTPTWTWDASTDSGVGLGNPAYEVQWSQDSDFDAYSTASTAAATFTHSNDLTDGTWYFRVRAIDKVGNTSGWSGTGSVYIDMDTPTAPGTPQVEVSPTNDNTPTWTWVASSDEGFGFGDEPYEVQWTKDENFIYDVQSAHAATEEFTHGSILADGTWHFRVRAVDDAGNVSAWSAHGSVTIDATAPTVPSNVNTDTPTKNSYPTWTWDVSSDDGVGLADPAYEIQWSSSSNFSMIAGSTTKNDATFTHTDPLDFGVWYLRVRAVDALGNKSAWVSGMVDIDNVPPIMSNINVIAGSRTALITWQTHEIASSQVLYGVGGNTTEQTAEANTNPRVTSHSVSLEDLTPCTLYYFKVASIDQMDNQSISGLGEFMTTACSGNAAVTTRTHGMVGASGGVVSLNQASAAINLQVPTGAVPGNTDFQIKQLSPAPALSGIGQPAGRHLIGSHIYDLKAVAEDMTVITNFDGSLTVSITYTASEAVGFDIQSLAIFRHDGSAWNQLSGCQVNATARVVSCQTTAFSVFGLFGIRSVATPPDSLPEGAGTVDPEPEGLPKPSQQSSEPGSEVEAVKEERGLSAAFTRIVRTIKRPVWWGVIMLIGIAVAVLFLLKRRREDKHVPYGIHRDK